MALQHFKVAFAEHPCTDNVLPRLAKYVLRRQIPLLARQEIMLMICEIHQVLGKILILVAKFFSIGMSKRVRQVAVLTLCIRAKMVHQIPVELNMHLIGVKPAY